MMKILRRWFKRAPKPILVGGDVRIVPAFEWNGETYYMHEDPMNLATGRGLTAMVTYEELFMRCDVDYLKWHCEEIDKIFSDPKKTDLPKLYRLHANMKERLNFLIAMPEHVYKMAAIVFFTKDESYFKIDDVLIRKKVEQWKAAPGMYDFFLKTPLKTLLPFLELPEANSREYLEVLEKIDKHHLKFLHPDSFSSTLN